MRFLHWLSKIRPLRGDLLDKSEIRRAFEEADARSGFQFDPAATHEESRRLTQELGIRPEDREFTRELLRMRYGEED